MNEDVPTPAFVGPYPVVRAIAQGGMAMVYEVIEPETGRAFAAKVLSENTGSPIRFGREYRALTRMDHPNVVRVYRYGVTQGGAPYLVMELLHGVPAQVRVKSVGRPGDPTRTREAVRIAMYVAKALDYMHTRGVVHRDLKSSNVLVLGDGQVKVLDFGTAHLIGVTEKITEPGEFVGTFHYASPEQLTGQPVNARSDLYALGVLLYRLLTGKRPFEGEHPHILARQHLEQAPVSPRRLVPSLPEDIEALTLQLLAKSPDDRPASAAAVVEALRGDVPAGEEPHPTTPPSLRAIGRNTQVRAILQLLDRPLPGGALLFTGIEGSGRGRLVELAVEEAQQRGFRTLVLDLVGVRRPITRLAELLVQTLSDRGDVSGLAAAQRIAAASRPEAADLVTLLVSCATADGAPVVLAARDLDKGARADVECLFEALERLEACGGPVLLFGSWHDGPVPRTWAGARTVSVPPLTIAEVSVLASHWLGVSSVAPELVRRLLAASGGMPAPLEEMVRALPRTGEKPRLVVPDSVRDSVVLRLSALTGLQRRAAECVALAEGDLAAAQISWAIDHDPAETVAALDALVAARLLDAIDSRWRFRMGVTGELVRERTRPTRRHLLCRRIADTVMGSPPSARLAEVLLVAGRVDDAAASAVAWAAPKVRDGEHADALPLLERIAAARTQDSAESPLWRLFAECLAQVRPEAAAADHAIRRARALAGGVGDMGDAEMAAAQLARARGDAQGERETLEKAVDRLMRADEHPRAAIACERLAVVCALMGALGEARRNAEAAVTWAEGPASAQASAVLAEVLLAAGDLRAAETAAHEALRAEGADGAAGLRARVALSGTMRLQGRFTEARSQVEGALAAARAQAAPVVYASLLLAAARVDIDLFRIGLARERVSLAMDALREGVPGSLDGSLALIRARLHMEAGEREGVVAMLDAAMGRASIRSSLLDVARLRGVRGLVLLQAGKREEGDAEYATACAQLQVMGAMPQLAMLAGGRAEIAVDAEDPDELFGEVLDWMEMQPARVARLEYLLAAIRRGRREADTGRIELPRQRAHALYAQIRRFLAPEDDAALAVHPWKVAIGADGPG